MSIRRALLGGALLLLTSYAATGRLQVQTLLPSLLAGSLGGGMSERAPGRHCANGGAIDRRLAAEEELLWRARRQVHRGERPDPLPADQHARLVREERAGWRLGRGLAVLELGLAAYCVGLLLVHFDALQSQPLRFAAIVVVAPVLVAHGLHARALAGLRLLALRGLAGHSGH